MPKPNRLHLLRKTKIKPRNRRIVITRRIIIAHPRVHMDMLILRLATPSQARRYIQVIQLLAVHVEEVRVLLSRGNTDDIVQILQSRDRSKVLERLNECEFVVVARGHDGGVTVKAEDLADERACDIRLLRTLFDASINRRPRIAVEGRGTAFRGEMDIDSEERARSWPKTTFDFSDLPLRRDRLARVCPRWVCRVDA